MIRVLETSRLVSNPVFEFLKKNPRMGSDDLKLKNGNSGVYSWEKLLPDVRKNGVDRVSLYNVIQGRSFILPPKAYEASFGELVELYEEDIVFYGIQMPHAAEVRAAREDGPLKHRDGVIYVTGDDEIALYHSGAGDSFDGGRLVFPVRCKDLKYGIVPPECSGEYGSEKYFGKEPGVGIVRGKVKINPIALAQSPSAVQKTWRVEKKKTSVIPYINASGKVVSNRM